MSELGYDPLLYWEARAPYWIEEEHPTEEWWPRLKPYINPDWKVLELGCGTGRWAPYFKNYLGADISSQLVVHAMETYPKKEFRHHDMRQGVPKGFDLIFTYTAWLHMPPKDIKKIKMPKTNLLFVEPHGKSESVHCFKHNYEKLFGMKILERHGALTLYGRFV